MCVSFEMPVGPSSRDTGQAITVDLEAGAGNLKATGSHGTLPEG